MQTLASRTIVVLVSVLALAACGESARNRDDADDSAGAPAGGADAGQNAGGRGGAPGGQAGSVAGRGGASEGGATGSAGAVGEGGRTTGGVGGAVSGGTGNGAGEAGENSAGTGGMAAGGGAAGGGAAGGGAGGAAGAGASNGGVSGTTADALAAFTETVEAFCQAASFCCVENGITGTMLGACWRNKPHPEALAGLESGAVTLDMAALRRCRDAYYSADACNLNAIVAACEGVFVGHRQVGQACTGGYDCDRANQQMSCMYAASTEEPGVCKAIVRAGLDEPCTFFCRAGEDCSGSTIGTLEPVPFCYEDDGLYCQSLESGSVCRPIVPVGAACDEFDFYACGTRARCDGTCVALSDRGEACGAGCLSRFTCSEYGSCTDPTWVREDYCTGDLFMP